MEQNRTIHVYESLPTGYREALSIHLQQDKRLAKGINGFALAIGLVLGIGMHLLIPIQTLFDVSEGLPRYILSFSVLLVGSLAYIFLHEAVHGITMRYFGAKRVKYGWTGLYAYAGSDEYFDHMSYLTVALAPVIV